MRLGVGLFRFVPGLLAAIAVVCAPARVSADRPRIAVGEVVAKVPGADAHTLATLRGLVVREVERLSSDLPQGGEAYVFSASLVRLEARSSDEGARATCIVSGILRRAGTGTLLAMMRGRGSAEDERSELEGAKERALAAAVHGAVRRVPDAL